MKAQINLHVAQRFDECKAALYVVNPLNPTLDCAGVDLRVAEHNKWLRVRRSDLDFLDPKSDCATYLHQAQISNDPGAPAIHGCGIMDTTEREE